MFYRESYVIGPKISTVTAEISVLRLLETKKQSSPFWSEYFVQDGKGFRKRNDFILASRHAP